jgi:hypothetical protein
MENLKRSFHQAMKHGPPVMVPEHPWEEVGTAPWPSVFPFGDAIWDEDRGEYRMWYTTATKDAEGQHSMLYATSNDGVHWVKPLDLGIVECKGSGANNILLRNCSAENVLRVETDPDPGKRYRMFSYDRNVDAYAWRYSPDGLHWGDPVVVPALKGMWDMANVAYDEVRGIYVIVVKQEHSTTYSHPVLGKHPKVNFRRWLRTTSKDGMDWSPLVEMSGDLDEVDRLLYMEGEGCAMLNTYGISLHAYHGVYLGIQWVFRITDAEGFWNCNGGPMDGRLLFSRDWDHPWSIPTREFVIPRGRKGEWDWGMACGVTNRPVLSRDGDEWWYYYGGWDYGHGIENRRACIGLAKLRVDGFASIDTFGTEGVLTFTGSMLMLNVDATGEDTTGTRNFACVELLDAEGKVLAGHARTDCDTVHADEVNQVITWRGESDVADLEGRVIQVRIYMKGAELYALQFVDRDSSTGVGDHEQTGIQ